MRNRAKLWIRLGCLVVLLCLGVAAAVFPGLVSESFVASALRILELVARLS